MDGFEVPVAALRDAAGRVPRWSTAWPCCHWRRPSRQSGRHCPVARPALAAAALAAAWRARLTAATDAAARQAGALQIAADGYRAAERGAVAALVGER